MLHVRIDVPVFPEALEALAEGLVRVDVALMERAAERGVELPDLYDTDIVYRREPIGREWWETAADLLHIVKDKSGDCEDLAAYRAAELRVKYGEYATVIVVPTRHGSYHAVVLRDDGTIEDPSLQVIYLESDRTGVPPRILAGRFTIDTRYAP